MILLTLSVLRAILGFRWQICMRGSILYMQRSEAIEVLIIETLLAFSVEVQNVLSLPEKLLKVKKFSLFSFVNIHSKE
jgi:hypothetical protein